MRFRSLAVPFLLPSLLAFSRPAIALTIDPHDSPDGCLVCHIAVPGPEDAAEKRYHLVANSIDETCNRCHAESACALGVNRTAHPSSLLMWDSRIHTGPHPRTLPLHEGRIVCTTCHYRTRQADEGYRMVRKAAWYDGQPDLTAFCADCHGEEE